MSNLHKYPDGSYMLYGTWSERKPDGSLSIDNLFVGDVGVFVDGTEYKDSISQLTGTATYEDNVKFTKYNTNSNYYRSLCGTSCEGFSLYEATTETEAKRLIDIHKRYNDGFAIGDTLEGNMILKADFEDTNSLGYVSGEINNFKDKQIVSYENIGTSNNPNYALTFDTVNLPGKLNLDRLAIGSTHSGFFDGNLNGNINSRRYNGKWGGQFYSYDANYTHPTNIAGTLAASSGNFNIIAPWFISNNEISTSLLPIHFRPPQENNPKIGLQPGPGVTSPTTAPGPGVTPPTDLGVTPVAVEEYVTPVPRLPGTGPGFLPSYDTYYNSINGFNYTLVIASHGVIPNENSIYQQNDIFTGPRFYPTKGHIDRFNNYNTLNSYSVEYKMIDGAKYTIRRIITTDRRVANPPDEDYLDFYGEYSGDVSFRANYKETDRLSLIRMNLGIRVKNPNDNNEFSGFIPGEGIKISGNPSTMPTTLHAYTIIDDNTGNDEDNGFIVSFSNDGTKNEFPNYVAGEFWIRDKRYPEDFVTEIDGVFVGEKQSVCTYAVGVNPNLCL